MRAVGPPKNGNEYVVTTTLRQREDLLAEFGDDYWWLAEMPDDAYEYDAILQDVQSGEVVAIIQSSIDVEGLGGHPHQPLTKKQADRACKEIEKAVASGKPESCFGMDTWTGA